jgi:6-phosphogluconolactonase (cycloisomerase 2 family)
LGFTCLLGGLVVLAPAVTAAAGLAFLGATLDGVGGVTGLDGTRSVAVSPDGTNLYIAGFNTGTLAVFGRDASTGGLTFVEAQTTGFGGVGAAAVAVSPDGAHVYAVGFYTSSLVVFARDGLTGALTWVETHADAVAGVDGLYGADGVTVSGDGAHVYVAALLDGAIAVFARNPATGALTFIEAQKDGVSGVDGIGGADAVAVAADGAHVYGAGQFDGAVAVFARNATTGALTFVEAQQDGVGGVDGLAGASAVAISPDDRNLYVSGRTDNAVAVFARNTVTGTLTFVEVERDEVGGGSTALRRRPRWPSQPTGRMSTRRVRTTMRSQCSRATGRRVPSRSSSGTRTASPATTVSVVPPPSRSRRTAGTST